MFAQKNGDFYFLPGPDWTYENQDGGGDQIGKVFLVHRNGEVLVKWPNGNICNYRCGLSGKYDVVIS